MRVTDADPGHVVNTMVTLAYEDRRGRAVVECPAAAFLAAIAAAFGFTMSALFDHPPETNLAVLGVLVVVVLGGMASYGVVPILVVVGFVWFGLSHHMTGYLEALKIAGWISDGLVCLCLLYCLRYLPGWLQSFKPRTQAEREETSRQWHDYHQAFTEQFERRSRESYQRNLEYKRQQQRYYLERWRPWIVWCHRLGLKGIGPVGPTGRVEPVEPAAFDLFNPDMFWPSEQPEPVYEFTADPDGRTARSASGQVAEVIDMGGDNYTVIAPAAMEARAEAEGCVIEWERETTPTYKARFVKKTRQQPPDTQGRRWDIAL